MNILLIHPRCKTEEISHRQIPLGLCYIASYIRNDNNIIIFDEPIEKRNLSHVIRQFKPDIIGITFTTQSAYRAYQLVKKYHKNALCIAGGIHATFRPKEALINGFDLVVMGEGELTFKEIIDSIKKKKSMNCISGIAYLKNKKMIINKSRKYISNLDSIPFPSWDLVNMQKYEHGAIITSRGCPYDCAYCASKKYCNKIFRHRSVKNVFEELKILVENYNQKLIHFCDDTFTIKHRFVKEFCKLIIKNKIKFEWSILSRVDTINNDFQMLKLLKKAGCKLIIYGIEAGSETILNKINKNIKINQIKNSLNLTRKAGINIKTTWIVGLPGNYKEQEKSIELMKSLKPNQITIHLCVPYPGTDLFENHNKYGISINEKINVKDWYNFNPSYYEGKDLTKFFKYSYLTFEETFQLTKIMKSEMLKLGYVLPNKYKTGKEHTIKTFLDKINNPLIKNSKYLN